MGVSLINTQALINCLKSGKIGSAGLDLMYTKKKVTIFFEDKSTELITDDMLARLLTFPNVLLISHQAFFTQEALYNIAHTTLRNFKEFMLYYVVHWLKLCPILFLLPVVICLQKRKNALFLCRR
ncbi:MAG: hypothetical protein DRP08_02100 [Candidatus Aenigmatarchaeota archaeon]|nr:MAG: hypothetical protein DRP08_02100 [Candidatus Aenigmarchaeota archaeon]